MDLDPRTCGSDGSGSGSKIFRSADLDPDLDLIDRNGSGSGIDQIRSRSGPLPSLISSNKFISVHRSIYKFT